MVSMRFTKGKFNSWVVALLSHMRNTRERSEACWMAASDICVMVVYARLNWWVVRAALKSRDCKSVRRSNVSVLSWGVGWQYCNAKREKSTMKL